MGIFNAILIYFVIFQPDPNVSYAVTMGQLVHYPYSSDILFSGKEISVSLDVSAGYASSIIMGGAPSLRYRQKIGKYITGFSMISINQSTALNGEINRPFCLLNQSVYFHADLSYLYFYELSDKYSIYSGNAVLIKPFMWGRNISPFLGLVIRGTLLDFPDNINDVKFAYHFHSIWGITFSYRIMRLTFSGETSRENLSWGLSAGVNW